MRKLDSPFWLSALAEPAPDRGTRARVRRAPERACPVLACAPNPARAEAQLRARAFWQAL